MANWKMHGAKSFISAFLNQFLVNYLDNPQVSVVMFPPAIYMHEFGSNLESLNLTNLKIGGQNIYPADNGAYTGEHSILMLKEFGCRYVLVGHSERRQLFNEDEKIVAKKFHHAIEHDIIPVLCIGETLKERDSGKTEEVLKRQLSAVLEIDKTAFKNAIVAYEPVWAIGTGHTANSSQIEFAHGFIRKCIAEYDSVIAQDTPLLYGGSVNESNAAEIFSLLDVDGGLVGGASLDPVKFAEIVKCIN